jgi:hypothetical protein
MSVEPLAAMDEAAFQAAAALLLVPAGLGLWSLALPPLGSAVALAVAGLSPLAFLLCGPLLVDRP